MFVTCPECATKLQLRRALGAGQRVRCPKCSTVFAPAEEDDPKPAAITRRPAPAPRPARRPEPEEEDDREEEYRPRPKPRRRKRRRDGNPVLFWGLIAGGAVLAVLGVVLLIVLLPSGNKYDAVLKDMINVLNEFGDVLESVKDPTSARAAAPRIEKLCDRLVELARRARDLPKPSASEEKRLQKKWEPELKKVTERLTSVGFQAGVNSQGEPTLKAALEKMQQRLQTEMSTFGK